MADRLLSGIMIETYGAEEKALQKVFNKDNIGFAGLQGLYWSAYCTLFAFLVLYLKSKGYTEVQTGAVMAAISLTSIAAQPFWGRYCDRRHTFRNVLVGCLLVSGVVTLFIPVFYASFLIVIAIALIISFTENSVCSIIDSWTLHTAVHKPWISYGLTRGMGSFWYAVTSVLFGLALDRFGYGLIFPTHLILILLFIAVCFSVGRRGSPAHAPESLKQEPQISAETYVAPVKWTAKGSGRYVLLLLSCLLLFTGFRAAGTFYPILLNQLGGSNSDLGISLFVSALSEAPVLFLSNRLLKRFKDTALIAVSMGFFIVKIILLAVVPSVPVLIAAQVVQGLSYALFLPASTYYIVRIAPKGMSSTYLTVAASVFYGIAGIIGSFAGGLIIDAFGLYSMLWSSAAVTTCGALTFLISLAVGSYRRKLETQKIRSL